MPHDFETLREEMKFPTISLLLAILALCWPATVVGLTKGTSKCSRSKLEKIGRSYRSCVKQKQEYFRSKALSAVGSVQV